MAFFAQKTIKTLLWCSGLLLLANALYLASLSVYHFGTFLPFCLGCVFVVLGWRFNSLSIWLRKSKARLWAWRILWLLFGLWLLSLLVFFYTLYQHAAQGEEQLLQNRPDAVLILGSGSPNCVPSASSKSRLDKGLQVAQQNPSAPVVVSGGEIRFTDCTEGGVMGAYLRGKGVADSRVVQEEASTSTHENLLFSKPLFVQHGVDYQTARIAIVSNHFHLIRAAAIAQKEDYRNSYTVGAETPIRTRYNIWLREYFAFVSGWLLNEY